MGFWDVLNEIQMIKLPMIKNEEEAMAKLNTYLTKLNEDFVGADSTFTGRIGFLDLISQVETSAGGFDEPFGQQILKELQAECEKLLSDSFFRFRVTAQFVKSSQYFNHCQELLQETRKNFM